MLHDQGTLFTLSTFRFMIVNLVIQNTIEQHTCMQNMYINVLHNLQSDCDSIPCEKYVYTLHKKEKELRDLF